MSIEWKVVNSMHVQKACEAVGARDSVLDRSTRLVVFAGERRLSAKEVLREAYRLATGLAANAEIKFASGESTLSLLRKLGFRAERLSSRKGRDSKS
jgi:hypothetical protein